MSRFHGKDVVCTALVPSKKSNAIETLANLEHKSTSIYMVYEVFPSTLERSTRRPPREILELCGADFVVSVLQIQR